ncbi:MAG: multiheme C-type cytochrome [Proteobacteria bacterium]|nr:multiheme C-type cytochrome [Pseudomonadota bacterium]
MKKNRGLYRGLLAVLLIALCPCLVWSGPAKSAKSAPKQVHPELSQQEQYIDCAQCHAEVTPALHQEWYDSRHGMATVKCYQCHGTFETFRLTPSRQVCGSCHAKMLQKCPQDKPCWQCHIPHSFKAKK